MGRADIGYLLAIDSRRNPVHLRSEGTNHDISVRSLRK